MWSTIWATAKSLAGSKKALAALVAAIAWIAGRFGAHLDTTELAGAVGPLWLYVVGQAVADHGKEAAKAKASNADGN
jgi:hypothetical protein